MADQVVFFRKAGRRQNARKRKASSSDEVEKEDVQDTAIVRMERSGKKETPNRLVKKTESKREKKEVTVQFKSERSAKREGPDDMGATAEYHLDTEKDRDAEAITERSLEINKELKDKEDDNIYRGLNNYKKYIELRDTSAGNAGKGQTRRGPIRAPTNIRNTVRWDYQPDICKDYKETGFCGFGDSCKFMHDRGDYKSGWQLEREYEQKTYGKQGSHDYEVAGSSDSDDEMPFACYICRKLFVTPVVTKCRHFFCEACALSHYRKSTRCFVCNMQTHGVFNPARELATKIARKEKEALANVADT